MVISAFYKSRHIEPLELPENRRIKKNYLTEKGMEYAATLISRIYQADQSAMQTLIEEQQDTMLRLIGTYISAFRKEMLEEWPPAWRRWLLLQKS